MKEIIQSRPFSQQLEFRRSRCNPFFIAIENLFPEILVFQEEAVFPGGGFNIHNIIPTRWLSLLICRSRRFDIKNMMSIKPGARKCRKI